LTNSLDDSSKNNKKEDKSVINMILDSSKSNDNKIQKSKDIIDVENKVKQKIKKEDEVQWNKSFLLKSVMDSKMISE